MILDNPSRIKEYTEKGYWDNTTINDIFKKKEIDCSYWFMKKKKVVSKTLIKYEKYSPTIRIFNISSRKMRSKKLSINLPFNVGFYYLKSALYMAGGFSKERHFLS